MRRPFSEAGDVNLETAAENRTNQTPANRYDDSYFAWQRRIGEFGGWANASAFSPYLRESDVVLDFGCGGGYLLAQIACARRLGVEVGAAAREMAASNGLEVFATVDEVPDRSVDRVISNHALEHVRDPFNVLISLRQKLRPNGVAVFVVPCEAVSGRFAHDDINKHLYTWNPMCLGNLFTEAGFHVEHSRACYKRWPPMHSTLGRVLGRTGFDLASRIYGRLRPSLAQVHLVASIHGA